MGRCAMRRPTDDSQASLIAQDCKRKVSMKRSYEMEAMYPFWFPASSNPSEVETEARFFNRDPTIVRTWNLNPFEAGFSRRM
ncbi:hypothetical protein PGTUg99_015917 [Puccinia graminis f. sp. tritici]|uniref:Uncharacterized protein n=1 Tax=Puccinia graminis f. sp. tritici TaxID=56615 RepID=A0A5B0S3H4_PUCGR|nr:hypothetical protein PGTUg99_015917 [Puccinia graminis f. sp. tritici]